MINKIDCWLLDIAMIHPVTLRLITPYDQCTMPHPRLTPPNLNTSQIEDILYRLFNDGFLLAITPEDFNYFNRNTLINNLLTKAFIPNRQQIKSGLTQVEFSSKNKDGLYFKDNLYFFLTEKRR